MDDLPPLFVDGIDGSGKTRFADRLIAALPATPAPPVLVHVDDFRCTVDWADPRGEATVYWEDYFDLMAIDRLVSRLRREHRRVVVEGIFTLRLAAAAEAELIYLDVSFEEAASRILERDTALGRSREEVLHRTAARYFPAQRRYQEEYAPLERAALLLDNTDPAAPRVTRADWSRLPAGFDRLVAGPRPQH